MKMIMNESNIVLPYDFVCKNIELNWGSVFYALQNKIISPKAVIEHAMSELARLNDYPQELLELASLNKGESVHPYIDILANNEKISGIHDFSNTWLYLLLLWVFENKNSLSDPLGVVEKIYADFEYPEIISGFVRYMPTKSELPSSEYLYGKWEEYLSACASKKYF